MPELIYYLMVISQLILPVVITVCSILVMVTVEDAYLVYPFLIFQSIMQGGIFVTYILSFRLEFREEYDYLCM
jgi:hypothetical protein